MTTGLGGPVSDALEADLRQYVRRHGVVIWLDLDGHYTAFVDRLEAERAEGRLPYEVHALRRSHLALMLALDGVAAGVDKTPLVVHLPGYSEETVRETPLLELYLAGVRYRKSLDTLVSDAAAGRVPPDRIAAFKAQAELSLEGADTWLGALLDRAGQAGTGLSAELRALKPTAVLDDLLGGGYLAGRVGRSQDSADSEGEDAVWELLMSGLGLPRAWRDATLPRRPPSPQDMAFSAASWALAVEFVDDLKRAAVSPHLSGAAALPRSVIDACRAVAVHLREQRGTFYRRTANETESLLADEVEASRAEDLGKVDTFRFEDEVVLEGALEVLGRGTWDVAAEWATQRLHDESTGVSFWLREDPHRLSAWLLVRDAARLGQAIARAGARLAVGDQEAALEAALARYVERGAAVDQAHRRLEQQRVALLYPQVPGFDALRTRLDGMRSAWRVWADAWARDFNGLCKAHGFVAGTALQQRALFDEVVTPLTQESGTTAYFMVDALRFEMGEELYRQIEGTAATTVHLKARLAELPTVTEVGMNALAPVQRSGRLYPVMSDGVVQGFSTGEFRVGDPETRKRAMHDRVGGATCPWLTLDEVVSRDGSSLKRAIAQAKLVVVHSREIDDAGEKGMGPANFDLAMQKLKAAWRLLRDAGVRRFVFTSDHGFLLVDDGAAAAQSHGRRVDPKRRHVFSAVAADHTGEVRVALADLGYEGVSGQLMFPESTAVFDAARRATSFVHGGNSLQERVIPVLTVVHRAAAGGSTLQYAITAEAREGMGGMHCLEAKVEVVAQGALDFGAKKELEVALRVLEAGDVSVELCHLRGKGSVVSGVVNATVGESFELFFRLAGSADARVQVELHHPSAVADVASCVLAARFAVTATRIIAPLEVTNVPAPESATRWLEQIPDEGARKVFAHLALHGAITEGEAAPMVGGARGLRRFDLKLEVLGRGAPFEVRIDVVAGVKRYVREGRG